MAERLADDRVRERAEVDLGLVRARVFDAVVALAFRAPAT
jgi:hypothetical protein